LVIAAGKTHQFMILPEELERADHQ
jgi:hypothetical protein